MPTDTPFIINETSFPAAKLGTFANLLNIVLPLLMIGAAFLLLVMLLRAGLAWISSGDNPESLKKAQQTITFAVFGLIIVIVSFLVVKLIGIIFNINTIPLQ